MVTGVVKATERVVMVKVPVVLPAATVTKAGTVADGSLLDRVTEAPPAGAAAVKVTVPVEDTPLATLTGLSATEESAAAETGVTVRAAVLLTLL